MYRLIAALLIGTAVILAAGARPALAYPVQSIEPSAAGPRVAAAGAFPDEGLRVSGETAPATRASPSTPAVPGALVALAAALVAPAGRRWAAI